MRNFVIAAAMAAMVCVIGCDRMAGSSGPKGDKGEQGDKGDRGESGDSAEAEIGQDCRTDADCDGIGTCTNGKFCAWTSNDKVTADVKKRREQEVAAAQQSLDRRGGEFREAEKACADSPAATKDCKPADEAKRHLDAAKNVLEDAKASLAQVAPATETAKADDKKEEKPAAGAGKDKKKSAVQPAASTKTAGASTKEIEDAVVAVTSRVGDLEGRTDGLEDNQKTLFGKTGELVVAVGALGKKIEAKPEASPVKPSDTRIFDFRRFASCVKAREADVFVGEGLSNEDRKTKIQNDCRAKQAG